GIPFSDPIAEGIVIQQADERALAGGCNVDKLFEMVRKIRRRIAVPLLFMTYVNPIFRYGKERFMMNCRECGIDGVIVPDLPFEERDELKNECDKYEITLVSMITPTTGDRVGRIAKEAEGFLYCVSSLGVTGIREEINTNIADMIRKVKAVSPIPCAVGFGISTPEHVRQIVKISDGVIVGSAIVRMVSEHGKNSVEPVKEFVKQLKAGTL
ncbi:MAG: tryptophan synthase subunit alpha, partial [Methanomassiliicoccaceae archaeon]|nr:tryptophan synthase subunit alpha [Methanomassiliicoccaceae archaeon]